MTHSMTILVVDDDPLSRRLLKRALEGSEFGVMECQNGREALTLLKREGPALLVLDYQMPELTGAQVCEIIRADPDPELAQVPIILLTALSTAEHEVECLQAGANDFVTKPVNTAVLKARIETHLRLHAMREQLVTQKAELEEYRRNHELDLEAARLTQQAILPAQLPKLEGWDFAAHYHPLIQVGGDIYDWKAGADGTLFVWISDATGHGASAALLTTLSKLLFRHAVLEGGSPPEVIQYVNREFRAIFKGRAFMTAACLVIEPGDGDVVFCGAGHPPLLVARRSGDVDELLSSGPPLGLTPEMRCDERAHTLAPGDALLLYTDGLYEVSDGDGHRLTQADLRESLPPPPPSPRASSAQSWLSEIVGNAMAHARGLPLQDDIAVFAGLRL